MVLTGLRPHGSTEIGKVEASARHVEKVVVIIDGSPRRADTEIIQFATFIRSISTLKYAKAFGLGNYRILTHRLP